MVTFWALADFVLRRMRANWGLRAVVALGILVAAILLASTTIYTRALSELGLDFALHDDVGDTSVITSTLLAVPLGGGRSAELRTYVEDSLEARFGALSPQRVRVGRSSPLTVARADLASRSGLRAAFLASSSGYESRAAVQGRLPAAPVLQHDSALGFQHLAGPIEVALPGAVARQLGIAVGDDLPLLDRYDECDREPYPAPSPPCDPTLAVAVSLTATVTGLISPRDPGDVYWSAVPLSFDALAPGGHIPLWVADAAMFGRLPSLLGAYVVETTWLDFVDVTRFDVAGLDAAQAAFDAVRLDLDSAGAFSFSRIERTLGIFETDLNFTEGPVFLLLLQIVAVVLFYVVFVAGMLVRREAGEIALLRRRGISLRQLLAIYAVEGLLFALVAVAVAPLLAGVFISLLGHTGTFSAVTNGSAIATSLATVDWLLAAAGAAVAVLAVLLLVALAARARAVEQRQQAARPAGPNVLQRYYLDLALVVVAAGLIYEADLRGSVFQRNSVGGLSSDPLLLVTPALFAVAFALVLMRALPLLLRVAGGLTRRRVALPVASALRHQARDPSPVARLVLLLTFAAALGTFAASYGGTVDRSLEERVRYEAAVDLRAQAGSFPPLRELVADLRSDVPAITAATPVFRSSVIDSSTAFRGALLDLLAIDPGAAADMIWFRDDFASLSLPDLMRSIETTPVGRGLRLPTDPQRVQVWALPSIDRSEATLRMLFRDGTGRIFSLRLGDLAGAGQWRALTADVGTAVRDFGFKEPLSLLSIYLTEPNSQVLGDPGFILFDDVSATAVGGELTLLEDFERSWLGWQPLRVRVDRIDEVQWLRTDDARSGVGVLQFTWALGPSPGRRGFVVEDPVLCAGGSDCRLPVIASAAFLDSRGLDIGSRVDFGLGGVLLPVRVVARADLFPSLDPDGFVVVNLDHLDYYTAIISARRVIDPREAWMVAPTDPVRRAAVLEIVQAEPFNFSRVVDLQGLLRREGADPLTAAGGSGILLLAFIAVGALVGLAFLVTVYVSAQQRRVEMAVLRTLGIMRHQILTQLLVEYALVIALGLVAGTILGTQIARLMLSFLEVTELGRPVLPPFQLDTDWRIVVVAYGVFGVMVVVGVLAAWRFFIRLPVSRVLRLTE